MVILSRGVFEVNGKFATELHTQMRSPCWLDAVAVTPRTNSAQQFFRYEAAVLASRRQFRPVAPAYREHSLKSASRRNELTQQTHATTAAKFYCGNFAAGAVRVVTLGKVQSTNICE